MVKDDPKLATNPQNGLGICTICHREPERIKKMNEIKIQLYLDIARLYIEMSKTEKAEEMLNAAKKELEKQK